VDNIHLGGEGLPLDPVSYSLAKKAKKIAENHALDSHTDVEITSPADGEVLTYDAANAIWKNAASEAAWLQLQNFDGIFWFNNNWMPSGMISNGTSGSAGIAWTTPNILLSTGDTSGSYAYVFKEVGLVPVPSWDAKRYFSCTFRLYFTTANYIAWLTSGFGGDPDATGTNYQHVGFKLINGDLYGTVADGSAESTLLLASLTETDERHKISFEFTPGVEARFYLDGVDKGAITTNLPSGTTRAQRLFYGSLYNSAAESKNMYIYEVKVVQEAV